MLCVAGEDEGEEEEMLCDVDNCVSVVVIVSSRRYPLQHRCLGGRGESSGLPDDLQVCRRG